MDLRRLVIFILLSLGLLFIWEKYVQPEQPNTAQTNQSAVNSTINPKTGVAESGSVLNTGKSILVTTDLLQVNLNTVGGDIRDIYLLANGDRDDPKKPYQLLMDSDKRVFVAQTGLVDSNPNIQLPTHTAVYTATNDNYVLAPGAKEVVVNLTYKNESGVEIIKSYTFKRNSYVIDVSYQIINHSKLPLTGVSAYWRLLRDQKSPQGETKLVRTYTGPVYYSNSTKFNKVSFSDLDKNKAEYPENINDGWVGFIQHYFAATWLLNAYGYSPVCSKGVDCRLSFKNVGDLASAGVLTDLPQIAPNSSYNISVPLFAGPEEYQVLQTTAPDLERTKDYGKVYIFATPLFWLLVKIFDIVKNWGWAIVGLTLVVKLVLYPLTRASYISMAKMKALGPKIEVLKTQYGDDKAKLQKAMMELYRGEKVNPIGGCLPMVLQIPVFIGLYWALLSSVELRQAQFLWIKDLSLPDPYYILPAILAVTMFVQTFLSPPPTDPVQAKMMRIMPVAFSVMFFFFPAGLVVYWLVNNVLSMSQQWYVNNHVTLRKKDRMKAKAKTK